MHPVIFIILGATGDLAMRKLFPALNELYQKGHLPEFRIVAFARRPFTDEEFRKLITNEAGIPAGDLLEKVSYVQGNFDDSSAFERLGKKLGAIDEELGVCTHKLFHLSISPLFYEQVLGELDKAGLSLSCVQGGGTTRLLIEKPIGFNFESAMTITREMERIFSSDQVFRIDHYLMKDHLYETLISAVRPSSGDLVTVTLNESLDVQGRGSFYDSVGALRDVAQNHALEMLALLISETPQDPMSRARSLERIKLGEIQLGQYEGYQSEEGVNNHSKTETYFHLKGFFQLPDHTQGNFIISGGKSLNKTEHRITSGKLAVTLSKPPNELDAYARMYLDAYQGIADRFVSKDEVFASWKIIDSARDMAKDQALLRYPKGWTPKN